MKINYYIGLTLLLGACAAPTTSIGLESTPPLKENFLFYIDEDTNLHESELLTTIQLPSKDYLIPSILNLLPNAKRGYRSGYHEGIDFSAPLNTPITAVSGGIVVRSNPQHMDVDLDTYNAFLNISAELGKTPDDIYQYILLGKSIVIDHGYTITSKFRTISVYAHLSNIAEGVLPGTVVEKGDLIGFSGNTGTSDGALRNNKGAHLHWELHFDDATERYFLGQNIPSNYLHDNIKILFD
ncbi:MAG: M23 family metallopeptidase [Candidatus Marinimicrobia bacterium]|jgi:murein DD-endopeptidase MepM/ murein hydrolase activator NlpD|nr:M23 family metallopeptidase [Candidatus Neomarinimicrobiota bacterium]MBT3944374.1 M23 family metallopeptidase [Candidatus Neomarinimicrobiota bacterium]MBT4111870.1 M23 family metallopeptidase [Candidatus Neomarinimicrobiota bacterium]MBT4926455.1 M23 family metallopeptidase [Candidatus Neomarinimicrobiota bacterium]MBT5251388.1 M23 family metallopeptidase [Candidatus Neomarinimicrobiota bacterium]